MDLKSRLEDGVNDTHRHSRQIAECNSVRLRRLLLVLAVFLTAGAAISFIATGDVMFEGGIRLELDYCVGKLVQLAGQRILVKPNYIEIMN
jgi:hypothetical protein